MIQIDKDKCLSEFNKEMDKYTRDLEERIARRERTCDKNTAAEILMREGWNFEQVATVLGYKEGDRK